MRRIINYILLVVIGTIALYPSITMALLWIDVWSHGLKTIIEPDITTRYLILFFTIGGCALTFGIICYFFLRLLQEDIKKIKKKTRERKAKLSVTETEKEITPAPKRRKRTHLKPEENASHSK